MIACGRLGRSGCPMRHELQKRGTMGNTDKHPSPVFAARAAFFLRDGPSKLQVRYYLLS
jgi:hypothetical protein